MFHRSFASRLTLFILATVLSLQLQLGQTYSAQDDASFITVSLSPISNLPLEWLENPPHGNVKLGGVPFDLGNGGNTAFATQVNNVESRPTEGVLDNLNITNPKEVFVLLSGGWVTQAAQGKKIGEFDFQFDDNGTYSFDVIAGVHIRETWHYANPDQNNPYRIIYAITPSPVWQNVWQENQMRGGQSAIAYLDMLTISIPAKYYEKTLRSITIHDTSRDQLLSPDPGMHIAGITVQKITEPATPVETGIPTPQLVDANFIKTAPYDSCNIDISPSNSNQQPLGTLELLKKGYSAALAFCDKNTGKLNYQVLAFGLLEGSPAELPSQVATATTNVEFKFIPTKTGKFKVTSELLVSGKSGAAAGPSLKFFIPDITDFIALGVSQQLSAFLQVIDFAKLETFSTVKTEAYIFVLNGQNQQIVTTTIGDKTLAADFPAGRWSENIDINAEKITVTVIVDGVKDQSILIQTGLRSSAEAYGYSEAHWNPRNIADSFVNSISINALID